MDIFPIDEVKPESLRRHCSFVGVFTGARKMKIGVQLGKMPKFKFVVYKALSLLPLRFLNRCVDGVCKQHNGKGTGYRYEICNSNRKFKPLSADIYDELIELPFRDGKFFAVKDFDRFLRSRFGDNYMDVLPLEEERKPSHCTNIYVKE